MLNSSSYVFLWFLKDKTLAFFQKCCSEAFRKDGGDQEFGGRGFSGTLEAQMFKSSAHVFFLWFLKDETRAIVQKRFSEASLNDQITKRFFEFVFQALVRPKCSSVRLMIFPLLLRAKTFAILKNDAPGHF